MNRFTRMLALCVTGGILLAGSLASAQSGPPGGMSGAGMGGLMGRGPLPTGAAVNPTPPTTQQVAELQPKKEELKKQIAELEATRDLFISDLHQISWQSDPNAILATLRDLDEQQWKATLAQQLKASRVERITAKIQAITDEIAQKAKTDAVVLELDKLVTAKMRLLDVYMQMAGGDRAVSEEGMKCASELAELRIRIVERRETLEKRAYGDTLRDLNKELVDLSLDADEQSILAKQLDKRKDEMSSALQAAQGIAKKNEQIENLKGQLRLLDGPSAFYSSPAAFFAPPGGSAGLGAPGMPGAYQGTTPTGAPATPGQ